MKLSTRSLLTAAILLAATTQYAHASGGGLPWEGQMAQILESIEGPVAKLIGVVAVVMVGAAFAFSEGGTVLRKALGVVMGLCIAFAATSFFLTFFGWGSGAIVQ